MTAVLIRRGILDTDIHVEGRLVRTQDETGIPKPRKAASEETSLADTLISGF